MDLNDIIKILQSRSMIGGNKNLKMKKMNPITILFLLISQLTFCQEYGKEIGVSFCVCDSNKLDSIVTLTRYFYQNGKPSSEARIKLNADCSIRDTFILKFDTLGRITASSTSSNISTIYKYDSLGYFIESITIIDGKTITHKRENIRQNNQLVSVKTYYEGKLVSISEVKNRKEIISNVDGKQCDIIRYNKAHHMRYFKSTQTTYDNEKLVLRMKNTFNSNGDITKSIRKTNGQKQEITTTIYQNNKELKEIRTFCTEKYVITTMYYYE